ncbi:MAG: Gfo/Idh/MocA family protein [Acutalibacteraceae bacterium]
MKKQPITAVIIGAGHRSIALADYSLRHPDQLKIIGVAEPNEYLRKTTQQRYNIPAENCFYDAEALASVPKFADAVINGTMDELHVSTSIPVLEKGYDMLLEKPFCVNLTEMEEILKVVEKNKNKVMVCHVLRYAPFYYEIKKRIISGELGRIINIQTTESVSFDHLSTSYVRGKWANSDRSHTTMLLAKCSHDIDLMTWLMGDDKPDAVSSFGSKFQFKIENAPKESGTYCLKDCPLVDSCRYSAKKIYIDSKDNWAVYVWSALNKENPTDEERIEELKKSPYGRCIYKCDNNVVDHQSVLVNFKSGATGTHNLVGGSAAPLRTIRVTGTKGEIYGEFENNFLDVKIIHPVGAKMCTTERIDLSYTKGQGHGGGETRLVKDFVNLVRGDETSVSCTSIENSVAGHKLVFLADKSRENGGQAVKVDL